MRQELVVVRDEDLAAYGLVPRLPEVFDASMLSTWTDCRSKFYKRYVLGLKRRHGDEQTELDWGSKWHTLQYVHNKTGDLGSALSRLDPWPYADEGDRHARTRSRMGMLLPQYLNTWEVEDKFVELIRPEQYFDIECREGNENCPYGGCGLRWCGRIDALKRRRGKTVVWDYKTTSAMGADYFDRHEHGFQMPGYYWAARHMMTDKIEGVVLDVAYTLKASENFFRRTFKYTDHAIAEWVETVKVYISEIQWYFENFRDAPEAWTKNWNECTRYRKCQFADIDFVPPMSDTRLVLLAQDYMEDRWDPRNHD